VLERIVFGSISHLFINFYKNEVENVTSLAIPWLKVISSTHSLKFLTGALISVSLESHSKLIIQVKHAKNNMVK